MIAQVLGAVLLALTLTAGPAFAQAASAPPPAPALPPGLCPLPGQPGTGCPLPRPGGLACPIMFQLQQKIDSLAQQGGIKPEAQKELADLLGQMQTHCRQVCPLMKQEPAKQ